MTALTVDAATRREFLALLAAAGLTTACAAPGPDAPAAVRAVDHEFGRTELSGTPSRVLAVVDNIEFDLLLHLGIAPVAIGSFSGESQEFRSWQRARLDELGAPDPQILNWTTGVEIEQVAAAAPDLIVGEDGVVEEVYPQLTALAPTLPVTQNEWREALARLGVLLGRED